MSTMETFGLGLQITGMGMGLVFLTLIILMGCIWALDRLFRPKAGSGEDDGDGDGDETATVAAATPMVDDGDEVAAITAAILMERQKAPKAVPTISYDDDDILGEIVTVVTIDSGQGTWKGYGRLQTAR